MERASWSDPPEFLMIEIAKRIDSRFDMLRIRSVCSCWRSSVSFSCKTAPFLAKLTCPIPWDEYEYPKRNGSDCVIKEIIICGLEKIADSLNFPGSSIGWLVMIEDGKSSIISSPKQSLTPVVLNLMDFRVVEICKAYKLQYVDSGFVPVTSFAEEYSPGITKTVVSSLGPNCIPLHGFTIFVLKDPENLGFLKLGDEKWTLPNVEQTHYEDIVSYKGKLYAVRYTGELVMFDSSGGLTEIASEVPCKYRYILNKYLVESFGDLLLVDKNCVFNIDHFGIVINFLVYKLDEQEKCWVEVSSLEDIALFVGKQCSFSVRAKDFNGNCIYFREMDSMMADGENFIYDIKDGCVKLLKDSPCPTDISWPPPNWWKIRPL